MAPIAPREGELPVVVEAVLVRPLERLFVLNPGLGRPGHVVLSFEPEVVMNDVVTLFPCLPVWTAVKQAADDSGRKLTNR